MHIIGTAGHVDHGKSTLIAALTGVHPDRLKEEIDREMTIDLGFASMTLPGGAHIGIVDVPGHRDFIGNMLSGIGGIDAVLLVIAADEGVSAQTREHLDILNLLHIEKGILVLTKVDLVTDSEWLDLIEMDVREMVQATCLRDAPLVRVSAKTGSGLPTLLKTLQQLLQDLPPKPDIGRPRLPVDRVFTLKGFGTVVTGTLLDGSLSVGDSIVCLPTNKMGRIRGLQNHNRKLQRISPGYRTAININGIDHLEIERGNVIAHPGDYQPTNLIDVHFELLQTIPSALKHNTDVRLYLGASETFAKARLLGIEELLPGKTGFIQLKLLDQIVAARGDRFILRLPSPSQTLGGGIVLDPHPPKIHRRFTTGIISSLQKLLSGNKMDLLYQAVDSLGVTTLSAAIQRVAVNSQEGQQLAAELENQKELVFLTENPPTDKRLLTTSKNWQKFHDAILDILTNFHRENPYKAGYPREKLRNTTKLNLEQFDAILSKMAADGDIIQIGTIVAKRSHKVVLSDSEQEKADPILAQFRKNAFSPPDSNEVVEKIGNNLMEGLIGSGQLIRVSEQILFTPESYTDMLEWVKKTIGLNGKLTLAEFRDHFNTSRKYATAFLEHLDKTGITVRKEDFRTLKRVE